MYTKVRTIFHTGCRAFLLNVDIPNSARLIVNFNCLNCFLFCCLMFSVPKLRTNDYESGSVHTDFFLASTFCVYPMTLDADQLNTIIVYISNLSETNSRVI